MQRFPVFVYGTLRTGQPNHRLLDGAIASVTPGVLHHAAMYGAGAPFPFVTDGDGTVTGELIHISSGRYTEMLRRLDSLEGFFGPDDPSNMYHRVQRPIETATHTVPAWVYLAATRRYKDRPIPSGDWVCFQQVGV